MHTLTHLWTIAFPYGSETSNAMLYWDTDEYLASRFVPEYLKRRLRVAPVKQ